MTACLQLNCSAIDLVNIQMLVQIKIF